MDERFTYHRAVAPMMWVMVALATIELIVMHLLLSFWSRPAALIFSLFTLGAIIWLVRVIASMRRLPVLLDGRRLVMRVGTLRQVTIPVEDVAGLRTRWDAAAVKQRSVLNLALIAYPNVIVDLITPLPGKRRIGAIAHRLDDPEAFRAALERLRERP